MNFSNRLKLLRKEQNITQKMLSSVLNLSANCICEWEKGRSEPNIETLTKLSDYFGVSTDYLLGREDDFGNIVINSPAAPASELTENEKKLLFGFRRLSKATQNMILRFVSSADESENK